MVVIAKYYAKIYFSYIISDTFFLFCFINTLFRARALPVSVKHHVHLLIKHAIIVLKKMFCRCKILQHLKAPQSFLPGSNINGWNETEYTARIC